MEIRRTPDKTGGDVGGHGGLIKYILIKIIKTANFAMSAT